MRKAKPVLASWISKTQKGQRVTVVSQSLIPVPMRWLRPLQNSFPSHRLWWDLGRAEEARALCKQEGIGRVRTNKEKGVLMDPPLLPWGFKMRSRLSWRQGIITALGRETSNIHLSASTCADIFSDIPSVMPHL